MAKATLPPLPSVEKFLGDLLGRTVTVSEGKPLEPGVRSPAALASYKDAEGEVVAVCLMDLELANFAGASFSLIPVGMAKDFVRSREVPDSIQENLQEIYNIGARLFDSPRVPDVHFDVAYPLQTRLPAELSPSFKKPGLRLDLDVKIKGYGSGRMSLLRAA